MLGQIECGQIDGVVHIGTLLSQNLFKIKIDHCRPSTSLPSVSAFCLYHLPTQLERHIVLGASKWKKKVTYLSLCEQSSVPDRGPWWQEDGFPCQPSTLLWMEGARVALYNTDYPCSMCAPLKFLNIVFCSCCSCAPPWLVVWPTITFTRDFHPHAPPHALFFLLDFSPDCCLLKIKTLFNTPELNYCNIELSTEICVNTILERTFPLSTEHTVSFASRNRRLKHNY